jgi:MHS family alpha-ketoglutarate permease-like MFS transporter
VTSSDRGRIRAILGGSAGNLVEWYDWYVFSAFGLYFAPSFFPSADRTAQLLNTGAIFAVGFLMRPIGAWAMGIYADRHGRRAALMISIGMMCMGSTLIALTPSHASIGNWAPALLLFARLAQGLSVGGEYGASATYLSEMASRRHRGFYSSFQYVTLIMGQLLALAVLLVLQSVLPNSALVAWGWRIPFAIGGALAIVVYHLRRGLTETRSFEESRGQVGPRSSVTALLRLYPGQSMLVIAFTAGGSLAFYAYTTYMQKFLVNTAGLRVETASRIMACSLFVFMLLQPAFGALSDRVGRKPVMAAFGILGVVFTVPIFRALGRGDTSFRTFLLVLAALVIVSGYTSINAVMKAELFPSHVRALGVALPYAIANALFGGTAEYVALYLKQRDYEQWFYGYVSALIGVSLVALLSMRDTRTHSRIETD